MVAALTSGPSTDLMGKVTATPFMGAGFYSPYVGAVVDVAKLLAASTPPLTNTSRRCRCLRVRT